MRIGFVSTWGEVGAAYVTMSYINILKKNHETYIYPRGYRKKYPKGSKWDTEDVAITPNLANTNIDWRHFRKWIKKNKLEIIFFNEQVNILPVLKIKKEFPEIKIGTYVDYYTQDTVADFKWYDFIICNTKRHYSVFKELHNQVFYVKWGVDINTFTQHDIRKNEVVTFFHSSGWSRRKGTDIILKVFLEKKFYKKSKLIIHSQAPLNLDIDFSQYNIEIINRTVPHPGLYHLGDVYLYPTRLEGLGLTMYEALVSGLPIVVPDNGPMNEIISGENGKLLSIKNFVTRSDGYYWPLCETNEDDLADAMEYYISKKENIYALKHRIRNQSIKDFNWLDREKEINSIFSLTKNQSYEVTEINNEIRRIKRKYKKVLGKAMLELTSNKYLHTLAKERI